MSSGRGQSRERHLVLYKVALDHNLMSKLDSSPFDSQAMMRVYGGT